MLGTTALDLTELVKIDFGPSGPSKLNLRLIKNLPCVHQDLNILEDGIGRGKIPKCHRLGDL